ncbi:uncharacterized protein Bfra_005706 [Botrytis fragariae]|uniref:Uncharacterized protein n=1 Tax=Botrytis fragariae TaxID=1964551 RepID=A0A8H6ARL6_9HELO|nr:uncharacterized protein Bfra_005706 [Botrytis fragariae]KAF5872347.1 hypothetical protein Bfra_005706 [Botrytis fragariae]
MKDDMRPASYQIFSLLSHFANSKVTADNLNAYQLIVTTEALKPHNLKATTATLHAMDNKQAIVGPVEHYVKDCMSSPETLSLALKRTLAVSKKARTIEDIRIMASKFHLLARVSLDRAAKLSRASSLLTIFEENPRVAKKYNVDMIQVIRKWSAYKISVDPEWRGEAQFTDVFDSVGSDGVLKLLNESRGSGEAALSSVEDYMKSLLKLAAENEGEPTPDGGNYCVMLGNLFGYFQCGLIMARVEV